ncbi:MAG: hypothetical protein WBN07_07330 [Woeseiaceae bacterium]
MNNDEKQRNYELAEALMSEQNFAAAVIVGAVATLLAAAAYGMLVVLWPFSYGFAAVGIGIVIGLGMQFLGHGIALKFAVVAAVYTVAGCALGNLFALIIGLARATAASPIDVLRNSSLPALTEHSVSGISYVDLVYVFVAIFAAVFLAKRPLSREQGLALHTQKMRH